jgi:hypothetical protein
MAIYKVQRTFVPKAKLAPMCLRRLRVLASYRLVISTSSPLESPGTGWPYVSFRSQSHGPCMPRKDSFTSITQFSVRKVHLNHAHRAQFPVAEFGLCYQSIYVHWAHRFTGAVIWDGRNRKALILARTQHARAWLSE